MKRLNLLLIALVLALSLFSGVLLVSGQGSQPTGTRWEYLVINTGAAYSYDPAVGEITSYIVDENSPLQKTLAVGLAKIKDEPLDLILPAIFLNTLDADGWQVVSVERNPFTAIMKRPKQ